jgi:8-oxo-dGTP pyrophosphatase MutT (NUDIX family)
MNIAARGIIMDKKGKVFCVKLKHSPEFWCLPGGKLDTNERFDFATKRELIEELGVEPIIGNQLYMQQIYEGEECVLTEVGFNILNAEDYNKIDISKTTHGNIELAEYGFKDIKMINFLPNNLKDSLPSDPDLLLKLPMQYFVNTL